MTAINDASRRGAVRRPRWPTRRWVVLAFQVIFIGWLLYSVGGGLWQANAGVDWSIPHKLGDLTLVSSTVGEEAVYEMTRLHGKDIEMIDGYVAHYRAPAGEGILYVGLAAGTGAAGELTDRMTRLIAVSDGPFTNLREQEMGGQTVYQVDGMGAEHFYYWVNDKVVWLTVAGTGSERVLQAVLVEVE